MSNKMILPAIIALSATGAIADQLADRVIAATVNCDTSEIYAVTGKMPRNPSQELHNALREAEHCVTELMGEPYQYVEERRGFESKATLTRQLIQEQTMQQQAKEVAIELQEQAQKEALMKAAAQQREEILRRRIHQSCVDLAKRDSVTAYTNALCVDNFRANGLHDE